MRQSLIRTPPPNPPPQAGEGFFSLSRLRGRGGVGVCVLLALLATPAQAVEVAPHRALYTLSLESAKPQSRVVGADGSLGYEWGESCDGWTIEQRYKLSLHNEDDPPVEINSSFVTWESKDGLSYRFNERKTQNGQADDEIRGTASLKSAGGPGTAVFEKPKAQNFDLPAGTLFPTAHTLLLIKKGHGGENFLSAEVFDGSTFDGATLISAVLGPTQPLSTPSDSPVSSPLLLRPSWQVRLAFFPDANQEAQPDYELGMRLLANGVSSSMVIDYGDYVIRATLKQIEALPKPAC